MDVIKNPNPSTQTATPAPAAQPDVKPDTGGDGKVDDSVGSPDSLPLQELSKAFGTEFKKPDDVLKSIENLKSKVGDQTIAEQRKRAERYEEILQKLTPEAASQGFTDSNEYIDYLLTANQGAQAATPSKEVADWREQKALKAKEDGEHKEVTSLREELNQIKFEKKFGEVALKYYDGVKAYAQAQGINDVYEAYEKSPFKELVEADRSKNDTSVIENNSRVSPGDAATEQKAFEKAQKTGDWSTYLREHKGLEIPK